MSWHLVAKAAVQVAKKKLERRRSQKGGSMLRRGIVTVAVVAGPASLLALVVMLGVATVAAGAPAAAAGGALGIPPLVFSAYLNAEANASSIEQTCVVDWPIIAGIWKVESDHATFGGRTIRNDGVVAPPLFGPTLNGSIAGTATIPDTDGGALDGDPVWDRAVGPAQFLPGSWRTLGQDGNRDGLADPHNVFDAALGTVAHLCLATPGDYTIPQELAGAVRGYNHSANYVTVVLGWIEYYRAFQFTDGAVTADGLYAFPLPTDSVTVDQIRRTHHDYPASDLAVAEGTPVYAAHPGTVIALHSPCADTDRCRCGWGVTIDGFDNHRYTYCHGQQLTPEIEVGKAVAAGEAVMASGNTGNSTGPHLHFQIGNPQGELICPQHVLEAWWNGISLNPISAPTSGCTH